MCVTFILGCVMEDTNFNESKARKRDDEEPEIEISARAGEMQPNPRLQERPDSPEKISHGHESFRHLVKPGKKSEDSKLQAFMRDAIDNGFRP